MKPTFLIASFFVVLVRGQQYIGYEIGSSWDGEHLDEHDHIYINLTTANNGDDLVLKVKAAFFDYPTPSELPLPSQCPQRPMYNLWAVESVEVFFLSVNEQDYLQVILNPQGRYYLSAFSGSRNTLIDLLPLFPDGININNPCTAHQEDCFWTGEFKIPNEYLPPNITKFNAYAMHEEESGEFVYEALYPVSAGGSTPNFHYLPAFGDIDLSTMGFNVPDSYSGFWNTALTEDKDFTFTHELTYKSDCGGPMPVQYQGTVVTRKNVAGKHLAVNIMLGEGGRTFPDVPSDLQQAGLSNTLDVTTQSFWVSFTNNKGEQLRVGVNPYGAFRTMLIDENGRTLTDQNQLSVATCGREGEGFRWSCEIQIQFELLPPNLSFFQMFHSDQSNIIALCPGLPVGSDGNVDWKGCATDLNAVVDSPDNWEYSQTWLQAISGGEVTSSASICALLLAFLFSKFV